MERKPPPLISFAIVVSEGENPEKHKAGSSENAIAKVEALVKGDARISVATLKTKYPQGAERSLIYATTGRSINGENS